MNARREREPLLSMNDKNAKDHRYSSIYSLERALAEAGKPKLDVIEEVRFRFISDSFPVRWVLTQWM